MAPNEVLSASSHTNFMRQGLEVPKNMHGRLDFIKGFFFTSFSHSEVRAYGR